MNKKLMIVMMFLGLSQQILPVTFDGREELETIKTDGSVNLMLLAHLIADKVEYRGRLGSLKDIFGFTSDSVKKVEELFDDEKKLEYFWKFESNTRCKQFIIDFIQAQEFLPVGAQRDAQIINLVEMMTVNFSLSQINCFLDHISLIKDLKIENLSAQSKLHLLADRYNQENITFEDRVKLFGTQVGIELLENQKLIDSSDAKSIKCDKAMIQFLNKIRKIPSQEEKDRLIRDTLKEYTSCGYSN